MNDLCPHCRYSLSGLPANARCRRCGRAKGAYRVDGGCHLTSPEKALNALKALRVIRATAFVAPLSPLAIVMLWAITPFPPLLVPLAALGTGWLCWQFAWWRLASDDPTIEPLAPQPLGNRAARRLAALSIAAGIALVLLVIARIGRFVPVDSRHWNLGMLAVMFMAPAAGFLQIAVGSALLARCANRRAAAIGAHDQYDAGATRWLALFVACLCVVLSVGVSRAVPGFRVRVEPIMFLSRYGAFALVLVAISMIPMFGLMRDAAMALQSAAEEAAERRPEDVSP